MTGVSNKRNVRTSGEDKLLVPSEVVVEKAAPKGRSGTEG